MSDKFEQLVSVEDGAMRWISVKDRIPPIDGVDFKEYIVFETMNNKVHHDYFGVAGGGFWNNYHQFVTHWMPMPEPPSND